MLLLGSHAEPSTAIVLLTPDRGSSPFLGMPSRREKDVKTNKKEIHLEALVLQEDHLGPRGESSGSQRYELNPEGLKFCLASDGLGDHPARQPLVCAAAHVHLVDLPQWASQTDLRAS